jgi:hypothetical protein
LTINHLDHHDVSDHYDSEPGMHVILILVSILGLAILILSGLLAIIRHAANDSAYAAPVPPSGDGNQWRDAENHPSSSMRRQTR